MSFIKGIELCRRFHTEVVEPLMMEDYHHLSYSSALVGPGSEVLGYDTEMSTDHDWGPRVYLFLDQQIIDEYAEQIQASLQERAPERLYGFQLDIRRIVITTVPGFIESILAISRAEPIEPLDWLTFPSQSLLEITRGAVYRDDHGQLAKMREKFEYYPHDIWLYLMASCWQRIGQEEHLMLRSGFMGDELGSALIASRLVRDIMNLGFLMERHYAPYPKWFGTAFKHLKCSGELMPHLWKAQTASAWREREHAFHKVYEHLSRMHNELNITENIAKDVSYFYDRPFKVMNGEGIARRLADQIINTDLHQLAGQRLIGSIDLITDNTDFRTMKYARNELKALFKSAIRD
ncbi:DUF4037 domain-containing protein [Paenibacillus mendelii]|uniref:DUF4037 domain-containing protein n=1 Tax=Paenibacillus mendelii TaxID=206163 RepID=A0ABV6JDI1_9BACL|nr:DUF4037 domain-containing protein [Paenibacillus mendelii]MCQ6563525.1 DUF4037 domain-containing protein [Paenibacillus mendelii]